MVQVKEILSPKERMMIRQRRARAILTKEGIAIIKPKKTRGARFREIGGKLKRGVEVTIEDLEKADKEFKKVEKQLEKL